jgi:hypothetical protein
MLCLHTALAAPRNACIRVLYVEQFFLKSSLSVQTLAHWFSFASSDHLFPPVMHVNDSNWSRHAASRNTYCSFKPHRMEIERGITRVSMEVIKKHADWGALLCRCLAVLRSSHNAGDYNLGRSLGLLFWAEVIGTLHTSDAPWFNVDQRYVWTNVPWGRLSMSSRMQVTYLFHFFLLQSCQVIQAA